MNGWDISQRLAAFFRDFDHWHYERMADTFLPHGTWDRNGLVLQGREAIVAELRRRPEQQVVRHLLSNIVVDEDGKDAASANFIVTAYRHMGEREPAKAPVLDGPLMLLDATAQLRRVDGSWMFEHQSLRRVFTFESREGKPS